MIKGLLLAVSGVLILGTACVTAEQFTPSQYKGQPIKYQYKAVESNSSVLNATKINYTFTEFKEPVVEIEDILDSHLQGKLAGMGDSFERYGRMYNVDPALLVAIAIHETGNGSSEAIKDLNNVGGIMVNGEYLRQFISVNASIEYMAWLLRNSYMDARNLYSIEEIGNRYCPEGVANDPTGLNKHWIPAVTRIYGEIIGGAV